MEETQRIGQDVDVELLNWFKIQAGSKEVIQAQHQGTVSTTTHSMEVCQVFGRPVEGIQFRDHEDTPLTLVRARSTSPVLRVSLRLL